MGQWVDGQANTNRLESFWSLLKRGYHGTFHHMSPEHLDRYVREFEGRYYCRPLDTIDQLVAMVRGMLGKGLCDRDLIVGRLVYLKRGKPDLANVNVSQTASMR